MSIDTKELTPVKVQVSKRENEASAIVIETAEDYKLAGDLAKRIKDTKKEIKERKDSIIKPMNESLKNARELFKPIEIQLDNAEAIMKRKIVLYFNKVNAEAKKKEDALAARVEKGTMKIETAERKIDEVEKVEKTVGAIQMRTTKKVKITNENEIPREYLVPDMVRIRKEALSGVVIKGVEVYEETAPAI